MILSKEEIAEGRRLIADARLWDMETRQVLLDSHEALRKQRAEAVGVLQQTLSLYPLTRKERAVSVDKVFTQMGWAQDGYLTARANPAIMYE